MGQFTSKCPKCEKIHYWFLKTEDVLCKCGYLISAKEIEDSWKEIYSDYIKKISEKKR